MGDDGGIGCGRGHNIGGRGGSGGEATPDSAWRGWSIDSTAGHTARSGGGPDLGMLIEPLALLFGRVVPAVVIATQHGVLTFRYGRRPVIPAGALCKCIPRATRDSLLCRPWRGC